MFILCIIFIEPLLYSINERLWEPSSGQANFWKNIISGIKKELYLLVKS